MRVVPATEDDNLAKAALFIKYIEALPHALDGWRDRGLGIVTDLLGSIREVLQDEVAVHQNLFRRVWMLVPTFGSHIVVFAAVWQSVLLCPWQQRHVRCLLSCLSASSLQRYGFSDTTWDTMLSRTFCSRQGWPSEAYATATMYQPVTTAAMTSALSLSGTVASFTPC